MVVNFSFWSFCHKLLSKGDVSSTACFCDEFILSTIFPGDLISLEPAPTAVPPMLVIIS